MIHKLTLTSISTRYELNVLFLSSSFHLTDVHLFSLQPVQKLYPWKKESLRSKDGQKIFYLCEEVTEMFDKEEHFSFSVQRHLCKKLSNHDGTIDPTNKNSWNLTRSWHIAYLNLLVGHSPNRGTLHTGILRLEPISCPDGFCFLCVALHLPRAGGNTLSTRQTAHQQCVLRLRHVEVHSFLKAHRHDALPDNAWPLGSCLGCCSEWILSVSVSLCRSCLLTFCLFFSWSYQLSVVCLSTFSGLAGLSNKIK